LLAATFATTLQCEEKKAEPCMKCDSCKKAIGKNHPDIIMVSHEKPGTISIDEIREQVINDVAIKPYCSPYKIYIIADAEMMTIQAQNALLKTIEEPPEYAVIMLLTSNADSLLPTIQSRCVRLDLKVVDDSLVKKYLMEHLHIPDYQAEIDASFAQGSIGRAKEAATSEEFSVMTQNALKILKYANTMEVYELTDAIKNITTDKQNINDYLDIFQFWFRDVLMFKATKEIDNLVFKQEINYIKEQASERSYENLEKILEALEKTKVRLRANVNVELALELLFLTIREK
ncbi:MAG TPA: DNA polymerase III subunit delta, partial [Candidatus Blautia faecigallinarum]|nr:DNA polymerase III subunit delta [Candidatus Blautia faecigallinarum]